MTSRLRAESRPLVGSSRKRILGLVMRRLATPRRFFWPPLRPFLIGVPTMVSAWPWSPKLVMRSLTRRRASLRPTCLLVLVLVEMDHAVSRGRCIPGKSKSGSKHHSLPDGQAADESIVLLDIGREIADHRSRSRKTIETDLTSRCGACSCNAMGKGIQQRRLSRATGTHDSQHLAGMNDACDIVEDAKGLFGCTRLDGDG